MSKLRETIEDCTGGVQSEEPREGSAAASAPDAEIFDEEEEDEEEEVSEEGPGVGHLVAPPTENEKRPLGTAVEVSLSAQTRQENIALTTGCAGGEGRRGKL